MKTLLTILILCSAYFSASSQPNNKSIPTNIIIKRIGMSDKYFDPILITLNPDYVRGQKPVRNIYMDIILADTASFNLFDQYISDYINCNKDSCQKKCITSTYNCFQIEVSEDVNFLQNNYPVLRWHNLLNIYESEKYFMDLINSYKKQGIDIGSVDHIIASHKIVATIIDRIITEIIFQKAPY